MFTLAESYPEFFARLVAYFAAESWQIVKANAVPSSGILAVAALFVLGLWKALELVLWTVRKLWPLLLLLGTASVAVALVQVEGG